MPLFIGCVDSDGLIPNPNLEAQLPADSENAEATGEVWALELRNPGGFVIAEQGVTDVRAAVNGGEPPFRCRVLRGTGVGTVPAGVRIESHDRSGCTLRGGVDLAAGDRPGVYGFLMQVRDARGATLEVPVIYEGVPCTTESVVLSPSTADFVAAPGQARDWTVDLLDVDGVPTERGCSACSSMELSVAQPMAIADGNDCADGGVCAVLEQAVSAPTACPSSTFTSLRQRVSLDKHEPIRKGAAFSTLDMDATYTGDSYAECTGKSWSCHIDTLEIVDGSREVQF